MRERIGCQDARQFNRGRVQGSRNDQAALKTLDSRMFITWCPECAADWPHDQTRCRHCHSLTPETFMVSDVVAASMVNATDPVEDEPDEPTLTD